MWLNQIQPEKKLINKTALYTFNHCLSSTSNLQSMTMHKNFEFLTRSLRQYIFNFYIMELIESTNTPFNVDQKVIFEFIYFSTPSHILSKLFFQFY